MSSKNSRNIMETSSQAIEKPSKYHRKYVQFQAFFRDHFQRYSSKYNRTFNEICRNVIEMNSKITTYKSPEFKNSQIIFCLPSFRDSFFSTMRNRHDGFSPSSLYGTTGSWLFRRPATTGLHTAAVTAIGQREK